MNRKSDIGEFVRLKLEDEQIQASAASWKAIRKKYRRERFLRFRPGSFNIYYLGASLLVAAGLTAGLLDEGREEVSSEAATELPMADDMTVNSPASKLETARESAGKPGEEAGNTIREESETALAKQNVKGGNDLSPSPADPFPAEVRSDKAIGDKDQGLPGSAEEKPTLDPTEEYELNSFFLPSVDEGCAPLRVKFQNESSGGLLYHWNFGNGEKSAQRHPVYTFTEAGTYTVRLEVRNEHGKAAIHRHLVKVKESPVAEFSVEDAPLGINGIPAVDLVNYSFGSLDHYWTQLNSDGKVLDSWSSEEVQPRLNRDDVAEGAAVVRLVAVNTFSCADTFTQALPEKMIASTRELRFATAFEASHTGPSGGYYALHEKNIHIFHPVFEEAPATYQLMVYSRTGELVFETQDLYQGWDGYVRDQRAKGGVFLWICEGQWEDGSSFAYRGDVTLFWSDVR